MLDPSSSFVRLARPTRLLMWITCIALASVFWPISALADDPNQLAMTGVPVIDSILKVLGALYVLLSTLLLILPKTSKIAQVVARWVADLKGIVPQAAAVKEATTGEMARKMKRESTIPPPGSSPPPLSVLALMAFGLFVGCKTNAARTACDIVHIVDDGCETFVNVPLPDGTVEKVPRAEIVKLAKASKAARLSGAP